MVWRRPRAQQATAGDSATTSGDASPVARALQSEFRLEPLEPRVMFSADLPFAALADIGASTAMQAASQTAFVAPVQAHAQSIASAGTFVRPATEGGIAEVGPGELARPVVASNIVVLIQGDVPDLDRLVADLAHNAPASTVVVLGAADSVDAALARIGDALAAREGVTELHLISHGEDGELVLGGQRLDTVDLLARADAVERWGLALADGADILLYGCDVAASSEGRAFVDTLASLTGADVAASDDTTGARAQGGDWRLEYARGDVLSDVLPGAAMRAQFDGTLATLTVDSLLDVPAGDPAYVGTLRWAIANATDGDTIAFSTAGTIDLQSALSNITARVTIDGRSAPGFWGEPVITLDGSAAGPGDGLSFVAGSDNSRVYGLSIIGFAGSGIRIDGADENTIADNHIGIDGARVLGNGGDGVTLVDSRHNWIGGFFVNDGNVISGNAGNGISLSEASTNSNFVWNNFVGTGVDGMSPVANALNGILVRGGAHGNALGGNGLGNIVSGNGEDGIRIDGAGSDENVVAGNLIGLARDGDSDLGNVGAGVHLTGGTARNVVGVSEGAGVGNLVSGNDGTGILVEAGASTLASGNVIAGNRVGTDAAGLNARPNGGDGIALRGGAHDNVIGGARTAGEGNLVSGNAGSGIVIFGSDSNDNALLGNVVGLDASRVPRAVHSDRA